MINSKTCSYSKTIKTAHVFPTDANMYGTIFGGKLMAHIDDAAAIAAVRHARTQVVTASTDSVDFLSPVKVGDAIIVEAMVTYAYRTSMEVFVKVLREGLIGGDKTVCATAFLTFVALDESGNPAEIPNVQPETEFERLLHEGAPVRRQLRQNGRKESKAMVKILEKLEEDE